ncbi:MAG: 50S ribosomal protein L31 [Planctomycetes bacterium]|nr:50S ribosomal protein L31 [Planctomycetota bacterium]
MKKKIHPKYVDCKVTCGCGSSFETMATVPIMKIEICSSCHPFYTGRGDKLVDSLGRVDRFTKKYGGEYFAKPEKKEKPKARRYQRGG